MIRALTLDAGGTLIEPWPSVGAVYAEVAADFGMECEPGWLNSQFVDTWRARAAFGYTRAEWFDVVRQSFAGSGEVSRELFEAIYRRFEEKRAWLIYEDVIPALQRAEAAGLKLAVVSNWDERLVPLLEKLGLASYFAHVIVSAAVAAHKPDRRIFDRASLLLDVEPAGIAHIGDSLREDVQGARAAGFNAFRIRRSGAAEPHDVARLTDIFERPELRPISS